MGTTNNKKFVVIAAGARPYEGHFSEWNARYTHPCCDEIVYALDVKAIGLGEYDDWYFDYDRPKLSIYKCWPYEEGATYDDFPIDYCPFCGAQIIVVYILDCALMAADASAAQGASQ